MPCALLRELIAEATLDSADHAYRLTVTATNDRSDGVEPGLDLALAVDPIADDTVDDFDAQPTAYRVRSPLLAMVIATVPPR